MKMKKLSLLSWNCRGLGNLDKCLVVRNLIRSSRCDVVCLQETKWNKIDLVYIASVLPSFFERNCVYIHAIGSRGGCLISWKRSYRLQTSWATRHTITAELTQISTGQHFLVTNTYGPSREEQKKAT